MVFCVAPFATQKGIDKTAQTVCNNVQEMSVFMLYFQKDLSLKSSLEYKKNLV